MTSFGSSGKPLPSFDEIWLNLKAALNCFYGQKTPDYMHSGLLLSQLHRDMDHYFGRGNGSEVSSASVSILLNKLEDYFGNIVDRVLEGGRDLDDVDLLKYYMKEWLSYKTCSKVANGICEGLYLYLIKDEPEKNINIFEIYALAVNTWKQHLFEVMHQKLMTAVLKLIERKREGKAIDKNLISVAIQCYVLDVNEIEGVSVSQAERDAKETALCMYHENFERFLLEDTESFYTKKATDFIANNSVTEYMHKVDNWLNEEEHLRNYLHSSTMETLVKSCKKVLITKQLNLFLNEFRYLLVANKHEDLAPIYSFCNRVDDGHRDLKVVFEEHFKDQLASTVKKCDKTNPKNNLDTMLVLRRYNIIVERSFSSDPSFVQILDKTWAAFINETPTYLLREDLRELKSTQKDYAITCVKELIAKHVNLIKIEFHDLLIASKDEDLAYMYSLIHPKDDVLLEGLRTELEKHIEEQGILAIKKCGEEDPKIYVNTILEVHRRYNTLVKRSFRNECGFADALDKACAAFINKDNLTIKLNSTSKSPELLARYCDLLLKKSAKNYKEAELEDSLAEMIVFKYIEDKDIFEKFYSKMLAKRLVSGLSVNDDAESSMINKLQEMYGCDYTSRLQRMLTNWRLSKELNEAFKEHESNAKIYLNLDFSIVVFNSGAWPFRQTFTFEIPSELGSCIDRFTTFYIRRHNGRKLTWLLTSSKGELTTNCFQKKYIFTASTVQMALLLMFNESVEYTIGTLVENLKLKKEVLVQVILALVKIQLLELVGRDSGHKSSSTELFLSTNKDMEGETSDMTDDIIIRLNTSFSNKKLKVHLSKARLQVEERQEQEQVSKDSEEKRRILIQTAVVRIMKKFKRLKHQQLMSEIPGQLTPLFEPKVPMIKKCIESLIEKEYMMRVEGEKDLYEYLA
uniref:Cullin family profile domain-containing protein n=1 Tax=Plectus sambesii TaxID=2011161 RepID=A0A914W0B5_9BILA